MPIDDGIRGAGPAPRRDRAPHVRGHVRSGATVVAVLHDLTWPARDADRVAVIAAGQFVTGGTPEEMLTEPVLTAAYGHPGDVVPHPRSGLPLVMPRR